MGLPPAYPHLVELTEDHCKTPAYAPLPIMIMAGAFFCSANLIVTETDYATTIQSRPSMSFDNGVSLHQQLRGSMLENEMRNKIKVGVKLKKTEAPDYILEVMEFTTPEGNLPHARTRVRISSFDLGVRLYSVSAL